MEVGLEGPMVRVSRLMSVKMHAMVNLVLAQKFSVSVHAQIKSTSMKSVTKTAARMPQSSFITAHFQSN